MDINDKSQSGPAFDRIKREIVEDERDIRAGEVKIAPLNSKIRSEESRVKATQNELSNEEAELQRLKTEAAEIKREVDDKRKKLAAAQNTAHQLERQVNSILKRKP